MSIESLAAERSVLREKIAAMSDRVAEISILIGRERITVPRVKWLPSEWSNAGIILDYLRNNYPSAYSAPDLMRLIEAKGKPFHGVYMDLKKLKDAGLIEKADYRRWVSVKFPP